jgi:protein-S-isoprenylcysteine O-methyltransferase Ste14
VHHRQAVTLRGAVVVLVYVIYFRELWVAVRSFTRLGFSINAALLGISYGIIVNQTQLVPLYVPGIFIGVPLLLVSLVLLEWGGRSIRGQMFSYLGNRDTPTFVFQSGSYSYIRHPFYVCYWLSHTGVACMFPSHVTVLTAIGTFLLLWFTAAFEEGKFARSPLADEYRAYINRTGRFVPRLRR